MFLMDGSDSIDQQEWEQEKSFVSRLVNDLDISKDAIHAGVVIYSADIGDHIGLTPFKPKPVLRARITTLRHPTGISTNTAKGIERVRETFKSQPANRKGAQKILIVITDGSSENPQATLEQAKMAKEEGIRIFSVGVGNNIFVEELKQIASSEKKYYPVPDFNALRSIEADVRAMICRVITTTKTPPVTFAPPTTPPFIPLPQNRICDVPADIVFVIDGSDSISDPDFSRLKNFVANLIDNFEISPQAIHIGMIVYSTLIGETVGLQPFKSKMVLKVFARNLAHPKFGTNTAKGISAAIEMIGEQGRQHAPKIIVVITDGRSTNPRDTIYQANLAKMQKMTIISVGVGSQIFDAELNQIASSGEHFYVQDFAALEQTVQALRNLICLSLTTTSTSTTTEEIPTTPPGILPLPEGRICDVPADVVFLMDGSDSIHPSDWKRQTNFVANLVNNLQIGPTTIHAGVVVYSSQIGETIDLAPFKPKPVLMARAKTLSQPRFGTDTALGIQKVREMIKTQGRPNAPRVAVIITDGRSTYPAQTINQASLAKADGIVMIAVGVGDLIFMDELSSIATSERKLFNVTDFRSLQLIVRSLRDLICQVIKTTTPPPTTSTTTVPPTTPMTTPVTVPLTPCIESRTMADIVFLVDGSSRLNKYEWVKQTHFMANFLDGIEIGPEYVHVGMVVYGTAVGDTVGIKPFKPRYKLQEHSHGLLHPQGESNAAVGIKKAREIFQTQGRVGSPQFIVHMTDGPTSSLAESMYQANEARVEGITIISVGVGNVPVTEQQAIASSASTIVNTQSFDTLPYALEKLRGMVCSLLAVTTPAPPTTTPTPGLCDGCLIDNGVGFNPFPGDCTKFVQCWKEGNTVQAVVRSCPFGQFWDADAITCRPSFLVTCAADPCATTQAGFTYGMPKYGCRAYFKCLDGRSIGHCCALGTAYVEGLGCMEDKMCTDVCPPEGGIAVSPGCDKKPHWDKRYYIEVVLGRGEVVRPCPPGTGFSENRCECDVNVGDILPFPGETCTPSAHYPFDIDLMDHSMNRIPTGITNVRLTDLGTAYFSGRSDMNLWRFAGVDWKNVIVIKFKFRFDHWNKHVDYGGLPVDLGVDMHVDTGLTGNMTMGDIDWNLWKRLQMVRNIADWRQFLQDFGKSKDFAMFLTQLGLKPATTNTVQIIRILGTPEAFAEMQIMLQKLHSWFLQGSGDIMLLMKQLGSMKGFVNWKDVVNRLSRGGAATGSSDKTTAVDASASNGGQSGAGSATLAGGQLSWNWNGGSRSFGMGEASQGSDTWSSGHSQRSGMEGESLTGLGSSGTWSTGQSQTGGLGGESLTNLGSGGTWSTGPSQGGMGRENRTVDGSTGTWSAGQTQQSGMQGGAWTGDQGSSSSMTGVSGSLNWNTGGHNTQWNGPQDRIGGVDWNSGGQNTQTGSSGSGSGSWQWVPGGNNGGGQGQGITGSWQWMSGSGIYGTQSMDQNQMESSTSATGSWQGGIGSRGTDFTSSMGGGDSFFGSQTQFENGFWPGQGSVQGSGLSGMGIWGTDMSGSQNAIHTQSAGKGTGSLSGQNWQGVMDSRSTGKGSSQTGVRTGKEGIEQNILDGGMFGQGSWQAGMGTWGGDGGVAGTQTSGSTFDQTKNILGTSNSTAWEEVLKNLKVNTGKSGGVWQIGSGWDQVRNQLQGGSGSWNVSVSSGSITFPGITQGDQMGGRWLNAGSMGGMAVEGSGTIVGSGQVRMGRNDGTGYSAKTVKDTTKSGSSNSSKTITGRIVEVKTEKSDITGQHTIAQQGNGNSIGKVVTGSGVVIGAGSRGGGESGSGGQFIVTSSGSQQGSQLFESGLVGGSNERVVVAKGGGMQTGSGVGGGQFTLGSSGSHQGGQLFEGGEGGGASGRVVVVKTGGTQGDTSVGQGTMQVSGTGMIRGRGGVSESGVVGGGTISGVNMSFNAEEGVITGKNVINKDIKEVPVSNVNTMRVREIVQELKPVIFSATSEDGTSGGSTVRREQVITRTVIPGVNTGGIQIIGADVDGQGESMKKSGSFTRRIALGEGTSGSNLESALQGLGEVVIGSDGKTKMLKTADGRLIPIEVQMTGQGAVAGEVTINKQPVQNQVVGTIERTIQKKVIPGGAITFQGSSIADNAVPEGGGGAIRQRIISRDTVPVGSLTLSGKLSGRGDSGSDGGQTVIKRTVQSQVVPGGSVSFSGISSGTTGMRSSGGTSGDSELVDPFANLGFLTSEGAEHLLDTFSVTTRKKRSTRRSKRSVNPLDYQALVTNCQGRGNQGPSIMIVANENDVQFALKTYDHKDPAVVSVPIVEGWNDVTMIYDGRKLTGVVENWKGMKKDSLNLSGNIERRQAGLLVGSCEGFKSFLGEIDQLTVYHCVPGAIMELREKMPPQGR
ncbi:hypothetical protein ACJMK2_015314 [Sinanodonta woodiana]|uniref:Uncharacterized protein n=1 Tax=Sinanodonta woodiana TaxID=1069815 RepID=A0ABD3V4I4_SINWO